MLEVKRSYIILHFNQIVSCKSWYLKFFWLQTTLKINNNHTSGKCKMYTILYMISWTPWSCKVYQWPPSAYKTVIDNKVRNVYTAFYPFKVLALSEQMLNND